MDMDSFAARLRDLRLRSGLSQEALAARLGVSAQSVSKWENAANWPEAALILPLARLLGVSADGLLAEQVSRQEWEDRWGKAWKGRDHFALLRIAEAALKDWPLDRAFRFRRANEEYQAAALTEDETERLRLLHLSEGHFSELLRDYPGDEEAGTMLVHLLLVLGRRKEAEELAERLPHREKLQVLLRQGKERNEAVLLELTKSALQLLNWLLTDGSPDAWRLAEAILSAEREDGQLIGYSLELRKQQARACCQRNDADAALKVLRQMVDEVRAYSERCSSGAAKPYFTQLIGSPPVEAVRQLVSDALKEERFTSLRELSDFAALEREAAALPA